MADDTHAPAEKNQLEEDLEFDKSLTLWELEKITGGSSPGPASPDPSSPES